MISRKIVFGLFLLGSCCVYASSDEGYESQASSVGFEDSKEETIESRDLFKTPSPRPNAKTPPPAPRKRRTVSPPFFPETDFVVNRPLFDPERNERVRRIVVALFTQEDDKGDDSVITHFTGQPINDNHVAPVAQHRRIGEGQPMSSSVELAVLRSTPFSLDRCAQGQLISSSVQVVTPPSFARSASAPAVAGQASGDSSTRSRFARSAMAMVDDEFDEEVRSLSALMGEVTLGQVDDDASDSVLQPVRSKGDESTEQEDDRSLSALFKSLEIFGKQKPVSLELRALKNSSGKRERQDGKQSQAQRRRTGN